MAYTSTQAADQKLGVQILGSVCGAPIGLGSQTIKEPEMCLDEWARPPDRDQLASTWHGQH